MRQPTPGIVISPAAWPLALAVVVAVATPLPATAQPATLVADAVTEAANPIPFLRFSPLVELDGALYFFSDDGVHGTELWRSDGTEAGTWMVRDVCPGQCHGSLSSELVLHQGSLYFTAADGVHGRELWRSDGTSEGTVMVADVEPGGANSAPDWITPYGDRLLFSARGGEAGRELWATDGTEAGTARLLDIHPTGSSSPAGFAVWNGAAWFAADDGTHGIELWTTDGTAAGTSMVKDLQPGPLDGLWPDQSPLFQDAPLVPYQGRLLFRGRDGVHGWELWESDGTEAGTQLLVDLEPGAGDSEPRGFTPFAGEVYFSSVTSATGRELWKTNGTPAGTVQVADLEPGSDWSSPRGFVESGGQLFFTAAAAGAGYELWRTDGTGPGTALVADVQPGAGGSMTWVLAFGLHPFADGLLFQADDGVHGGEPWVTDGTEAGTQLLGDLNPGSGWSLPGFGLGVVGGTLGGRACFFAYDPVAGWELRSTAGVPGDVTVVRDIDDQASLLPPSLLFRLTEMVDLGGTVFFRGEDPSHGNELWTSDGTEAGTRLVRDLAPGVEGGRPESLTPLGTRVLFAGPGDGSDRWLWVSDGGEAGTEPLTVGADPLIDPSALARFGGGVYLGAEGAGGTRHLWRTDGTGGGTQPFPEGAPLPAPTATAAAASHLFLAAGSELWATQGDAATTEKLADVQARDLVAAGPLLFFAGDDPTTGPELWVSDGTPGGTGPVLDLRPGPEGALRPTPGVPVPYPDGLPIAGVASPPAAFFVADDGVHGPELWWSDGTEPGTRLLGDLRPGAAGSEPRYLAVIGSIAYFVADDGSHGAELWRSDGTEAGTFLLADLEPGLGSALPDSLTPVYGELFFSAWRSGEGRELWRTDGTAAGTVPVQDVNPGAGSSSPSFFTLSGDRLFFFANDGERGFELWSLSALPPLVTAAKAVGGDLQAGGTAVYTLTLHNAGDVVQPDNPGDELVDELPEGLTVVTATADAGTASVDPDGRTVRWNGAILAGGAVTVTIEAAIASGLAGTRIENQATLAYDGDGSGDNESLALTDDPDAGGGDDPTAFVVRAELLEIPTLGATQLALLALLLAGAGLLLARRG